MAGSAGTADGAYPVRWRRQHATVTLPAHIEVSNAGPIREQLLTVINLGATDLIVDMSRTISCDHAGADAIARAYKRAAGNGTQLRLVVTAEVVRRVLGINGINRLISIYPTLQAALAASPPASQALADPGTAPAGSERETSSQPLAGEAAGAVSVDLVSQLIDALADGVALVAGDGQLVLVNRQLETMFGYQRSELAGQPVELLIPDDLRTVHLNHRGRYAQAPRARPMATGIRLVGLCKNGATIPVEISLTPVRGAASHLTLAIIRDATAARQSVGDGPKPGRTARGRTAPGMPAQGAPSALDWVVNKLFRAALGVQAASELGNEAVRQRLSQVVSELDEIIQEARDRAFTDRP
jgi:anti-anti-sigma factor